MLRIPFKTTFNADGTILSRGPAAVDTVIVIRNLSSIWGKTAHVSFWNEHGEFAWFDFNIVLNRSDIQSFSVARMLLGDPRALPCPHAPKQPKHGPFPAALLFQTLGVLSQGHPPNTGSDNVLRNPLHGDITIEDLHWNGRETSLRVGYLIDKTDSLSAKAESLITNPDPWMVERLNFSDDLPAAYCQPVVYSRAAWGGLGAVIPEAERNVREAERLIKSANWEFISSTPSCRVYKRPGKPGRIKIPGKLDDDLSPRTFKSILRQAGLTPR